MLYEKLEIYYTKDVQRTRSQGDAQYRLCRTGKDSYELHRRSGSAKWKLLKKGDLDSCLKTLEQWAGVKPDLPDTPTQSTDKVSTVYYDSHCNECSELDSLYRIIEHSPYNYELQKMSGEQAVSLCRGDFKVCKERMLQDAQVFTACFDHNAKQQRSEVGAYYKLYGIGEGLGRLAIYDENRRVWKGPIKGKLSELRPMIVPLGGSEPKFTYYDSRLSKVPSAQFSRYRVESRATTYIICRYRGNYKWDRLKEIPKELLQQTLNEILKLNGVVTSYMDDAGNELLDEKAAAYKVLNASTQSTLYRKEGTIWVQIAEGTPEQINKRLKQANNDKPEEATTSGQTIQPPAMPSCNITKVVWERVKDTFGFSMDDLNDYLYICICRNRAAKGPAIINTRLVDILNQPVYILDSGHTSTGSIAWKEIHLVDTITQAAGLYPGLTMTHMPEPLQWSINTADYFWNPTIPVSPISSRAVEHICVERKDRLPEALQTVSPQALTSAIQESLRVGEAKAKIDAGYALPTYSRKHDAVSMMLPLHVGVLYGDQPIAALVLNKTVTGYYLATIVTLRMAVRSVRLFRNPENTWLKGVHD